VLDAVMKAPIANLPAWIGVDLGVQGYAVAKVSAVTPRGKPDATQAEQERLEFAAGFGQAEALAYYTGLKERFKVKILAPKPVRKTVDTAAG
jgi:peptidyl-prolyl cis-trans isomerase D